jgi:hypothetical protein
VQDGGVGEVAARGVGGERFLGRAAPGDIKIWSLAREAGEEGIVARAEAADGRVVSRGA